MKPSPILLYSLVACMVLAWSGRYIAIKIAVAEIPPVLAACLRISLAGVMILPAYAWQQRSAPSRHQWRWHEVPALLLIGLLGAPVNQILFMLGLNRTSVAHAGIITALTPLCVLLLAAAMKMERITRSAALGILIALAGVVVLQTNRAKSSLEGDGFILLATVTLSIFTVFNKRIAMVHTGITINTFAYVGGALLLLPLTLDQILSHPLARVTPAAWGAVVYLALFPSVAAYLIYSWALKHTPASHLAAFAYLQPLVATGLAALMLHEAVPPVLILAGVLIFAGVAVTERAAT